MKTSIRHEIVVATERALEIVQCGEAPTGSIAGDALTASSAADVVNGHGPGGGGH
jgi:hypothetical protein